MSNSKAREGSSTKATRRLQVVLSWLVSHMSPPGKEGAVRKAMESWR